MPGPGEKGSFAADIPASVLEEALKSVERHGEGEAPADPPVEVEVPGPDLAAEVKRLEGELAAEHDRLLRAAADLDNFRKRTAREREEAARHAAGPVVKDLIPAVDNLERALAAAPADDPLADGVRMVLKQVEEALLRHGVEPRSALGEPFDPAIHEALATVPTAEAAPGTVVAQHGRAWMHHGRLLRPAMVAVAAAPPPGDGGTDG
ncbi:MAG TPA: nucleotide exchange factor GrpE [Anaeromyxobacteraceae bacterium]|nr:nucleotide exchange factor GrpE [Anaeromyxobacteraceae bacterium]